MTGQRRRRHATPPEPEAGTPAAEADRSKQIFYEHMRQRGQLIDVANDADLDHLPAGVTHVQYPDKRVERVRFD